MFPRLSSLLALVSATGIGLLSCQLLLSKPEPLAVAGLSLVALSSLGFVLTLRRMQVNTFRTVMSNYADRQMQHETRTSVPSFEAPSAVL